ERLIDQSREAAALRFEVLKRIVGLEYYEELTTKAKGRYDLARAKVQSAADKLKEVPETKPEELEQLRQDIEAKGREIEKANAQTKDLERLRDRAAKWFDLRQQHSKAQTEWDAARKLIDREAQIKTNGERLELLDKVVRPLTRVFQQRAAHRRAAVE